MNWANMISALIVGAILYVVWMELQSVKSREDILQKRMTLLSDHVTRMTTRPLVPGSKPIFYGSKPEFLILESETPLSIQQVRNIEMYLAASGIKAVILDKTIKVKTISCEHEWFTTYGGAKFCITCGRDEPAADKFKAYVHERLDKMDVPREFPNGVHTKDGCRVGDRLDWVEKHLVRDSVTWLHPRNSRPREGEKTIRIPIAATGFCEMVLTAEDIATYTIEGGMQHEVFLRLKGCIVGG